jgi:hypothetical protein
MELYLYNMNITIYQYHPTSLPVYLLSYRPGSPTLSLIIETATFVFHCISGVVVYYIGLIVLVSVAHICSRIVRMVQEHYTISEEVLAYINKTPKLYCHILTSTTFIETPEICSICLDIHDRIQCIKTVCGHDFGHDCFQQWIQSCPSLHIICPICNQNVNSMTRYRYHT